MQYYNNNISNKLITILCCIHSLLLKCYTCTRLRVCPNHGRNTFTTFFEYVYTDMINFLCCVHLYAHHIFYELSIKFFPGKNLEIWNSRQKPCMTTRTLFHKLLCDVWYHPAATNNHDHCYQATKVINCVTVLVHITIHCSYKANRADSSTTWYGTPHLNFMQGQGILFQT